MKAPCAAPRTRLPLKAPCVALLLIACGGGVKTSHSLLREQRAPFHGEVTRVVEGASSAWVEELALVQAVGPAGSTEVEVLEALERRAALLGCDVILRVSVTEPRAQDEPRAATALCGVRRAAR